MATRTITTTAAEDEAIAYAHAQSQKPPAAAAPTPKVAPVPPPLPAPAPPGETEAEYFDRMTRYATVGPMVSRHDAAKNSEFLVAFASVPPENQEAAQKQIEAVIVAQGGAVSARSARYLWSSNTAAPPRTQSVEADVTDANLATVKKLTFDDVDADNVSQMKALMALAVNTLIRIEDAANPANFLAAILNAPPIQRQGADGYVEFPVAFSSRGGSFATLDTKPVTCTFS